MAHQWQSRFISGNHAPGDLEQERAQRVGHHLGRPLAIDPITQGRVPKRTSPRPGRRL